ncbi:MAG TPA: DUF5947 family protein [Puia sp.]|nr:DUF5947 family protein [Puia sp.]
MPISLVSKLRKIATPSKLAEPEEKCFFCGASLLQTHSHLADIGAMKFICTCEACKIIMSGKNGLVSLPQRYLALENLDLSDELWADFLIPVNMAFFTISSSRNSAVAYYPAAAGATESKLKLDAWSRLVDLNPVLKNLTPDLEALLINRLDETPQYFLVPVDSCYELIGRIRISWKGIFGGKEVNDTIREFFKNVKEKSF